MKIKSPMVCLIGLKENKEEEKIIIMKLFPLTKRETKRKNDNKS